MLYLWVELHFKVNSMETHWEHSRLYALLCHQVKLLVVQQQRVSLVTPSVQSSIPQLKWSSTHKYNITSVV